MTSMVPDTTKPRIEEKSREELIAIIHELMAEIERLQQGRTNSRNSSQPPSRDFKSDGSKKRKRHKKVGAKEGHAKAERPLVDNPNKVIEVWRRVVRNATSIYWIEFQNIRYGGK
jgi:hypothetical protein